MKSLANKVTCLLFLIFSFTASVWALDRGTIVVANGVRLEATGRTFADSAGKGWNFAQLEANTQHEFQVIETANGFKAGDRIWLLPSQFIPIAGDRSDGLYH